MFLFERAFVWTNRGLAAVLACLLLLTVSGCSSARSNGPDVVKPAPDSTEQGVGINGMPLLPPPSQLGLLSTTRRSSADDTHATLTGHEFSPQLPCHRVSVDDVDALFQPAYSMDPGSAEKDPAYACYVFTVPEYTQAFPKLQLNWKYHVPGEEGSGPAYAGLANLQADRWDWFEVQSNGGGEPNLIYFDNVGYVETDSLQPYFNSSGELVLAVVLLGTSEESLWILHAGENYPPDGQLLATAGITPLSVDLQAAVEDDDGTVVQAQWDFESDGVIDASGPLSITHTFPAPGSYDVTFTAVDNNGASAKFYLTVAASQWSVIPLPAEAREAWSADMALDSAGQPRVVTNLAGGLGYLVYAGGIWTSEIILPDVAPQHMAIALDGSGEPHVLGSRYDSQQETYLVSYAYRQAGSWQIETLYWDAEELELGFDAQQRLHAAWLSSSDTGETETAFHAMRIDGQWKAPQEATFANHYSGGLAMALDSESRAHLALTSHDGSSIQLMYLTADDAGLHVEDSAALEDYDEVCDMTLDAQGNPHVLLSGGTAQYAMRAGGTWQFINLGIYAETGALAVADDYQITVALARVPFDFGMEAYARSLQHSQAGWQQDELFNTASAVYALKLDPTGRPVMCVANDMNGVCIATLPN